MPEDMEVKAEEAYYWEPGAVLEATYTKKSSGITVGTTDVSNYYTLKDGVYTKASGTAVSGTDYYEKSGTEDLTEGPAGRKLELNSTGFIRHNIPLTRSIGIGGVVPAVNQMIDGVNAVEAKAVQFALNTVRKHNKLGIAKMVANGTALVNTTALTKATVYGAIVDAQAEFNQSNNGIIADYVMVSPKVKGLLLQSDEFLKKGFEGNAEQYTGYIGRIANLAVIEVLEMPAGVEFVMGAKSSFLAPYSVNNMEVITPIVGFPGGAGIQGELAYGFECTDANRLLVKKTSA